MFEKITNAFLAPFSATAAEKVTPFAVAATWGVAGLIVAKVLAK